MQFKNVIATIAALSVASAVASPVKAENGVAAPAVERRSDNVAVPVKRAGEAPAVEDIQSAASQFAQANAGHIPSADQVALAQQAAARWGSDWCDRDYDWSIDVPWYFGQYYYLQCYQQWPDQYPVWGHTYDSDFFSNNINSNNVINSNNRLFGCLAFC